jgi:hypothetical protein
MPARIVKLVPSQAEGATALIRPESWQHWIRPPRTLMGEMNYSGYISFLLTAPAGLTPFEHAVCLTVKRQTWGASEKQRHVLWRALYRIYPAGCGKWGQP